MPAPMQRSTPRRWTPYLVPVAALAAGLLVGRLLPRARLPVEVERKAIAGQMGIDVRRVVFEYESRSLAPRRRVRRWRYEREPGDWPTMQTDGAHIRFMDFARRPFIAPEARWVPPVALEAGVTYEAIEWKVADPGERALRPLESEATLRSPARETIGLATMAVAAILGLSATDSAGQTFEPRLSWEGVPEEHVRRGQSVAVTIRGSGDDPRVPRMVRIYLVPETRQLSMLSILEW